MLAAGLGALAGPGPSLLHVTVPKPRTRIPRTAPRASAGDPQPSNLHNLKDPEAHSKP
jgi:hypothetical protein